MKTKRLICSLLFSLFVSFMLSATVYGAVFNVTNPTELQNALTTAQSNGEDDTINVAAGTYNLTTTLTYIAGENFALSVIGAGADSTILDGGNNVRVFKVDTSGLPSDNSAHIFISGLTIQNGKVEEFYTSGTLASGLLISSHSANITVEDSRFVSNYNHTVGCGYAYGSGAYITSSASVTLINNIFTDNYNYTEPECEMHAYGGGAYVGAPEVTLINNIFNNNTIKAIHPPLPTYIYGGGVYVSSSTVTLVNNTFISNEIIEGRSGNHGGGAYITTYTVNIYNNIFWNNIAQYGADLYAKVSFQGNLFNNTFQDVLTIGTFTQGNNIQEDCLLTSDFHLQVGSPCIDAGANNAPSLPSTDFEGDPRIINGVVDIGADELRLNQYVLTVTKAGTGTGTVTSSPAGINCGTDCTENYDTGTTVTLTATPNSGSTFAGWSGDADCSDGVLTMNADKTCVATFTQPDLIISNIIAKVRTYGTQMIRGVLVNYTVTNQGDGDANPSCLDFYLSRDTVFDGGDVYVGTENIPLLGAGGSYSGVKGYNLPFSKWQSASGTWRVIGVADACDDNAESDETNNQLAVVAGIVVK